MQHPLEDYKAKDELLCELDAAWQEVRQDTQTLMSARRQRAMGTAVATVQVQTVRDRFATIPDMLDNYHNEVHRDIKNMPAHTNSDRPQQHATLAPTTTNASSTTGSANTQAASQ